MKTFPFFDGGIQLALWRGKYNLDGGVSSLRQFNEALVSGDEEIPFEDLLNFKFQLFQ
jgi:hypothetical protein